MIILIISEQICPILINIEKKCICMHYDLRKGRDITCRAIDHS
jgi:hypothetical protein